MADAETRPTDAYALGVAALKPRRVGFILLYCATALAVIHVLVMLYHYGYSELPWEIRGLFDLDEEQSFGTWFSSGVLSIAGLSAMLCGKEAQRTNVAMSPMWWLLGFGFIVLSIDEVAGMHESFNSSIEMSWAIPGGFLALGIGLAYTRFLLRLPRRTAALLVSAGVLYIGGAVGVELATEGYLLADQLDTLEYNLTTAVEEWLEMTGVVLFVFTVLQHLSPNGSITAEFGVESD